MTNTRRDELLKSMYDEVINLTASPLYTYRTENNYLPVIGEGSATATVLFVGEAPGRNEAKTGKPFCGAAGNVLNTLLASINVLRESIYITNIVKDRPQANRDPLPTEIDIYGPFLDRQIEIIQPKIIVTLGRYSMEYILRKFYLSAEIEPISTAHGKVYTATASYGTISIIVEYHPAATIYNRALIPVITHDFKVIREVLDSLDTRK